MTENNQNYLNRLKSIYRDYDDNESLMALADVEEMDNRARELQIYREQPKTQELIQKAMQRYRNCVEKLLSPTIGQEMTDVERAYIFATMDWAIFVLDIVGEDPGKLGNEVDKIVLSYAQKVGLV